MTGSTKYKLFMQFKIAPVRKFRIHQNKKSVRHPWGLHITHLSITGFIYAEFLIKTKTREEAEQLELLARLSS